MLLIKELIGTAAINKAMFFTIFARAVSFIGYFLSSVSFNSWKATICPLITR